MTEEKKIQEIILKYEDFIQSSCADITTSIKGKRFFYMTDEKSGELYSVLGFNTAEELEQIILHELADGMNLAIEVGLENLNKVINERQVSYGYCEYGNAINHLADSLEIVQKEFNAWSKKIQTSLNGFDVYFNKIIKESGN